MAKFSLGEFYAGYKPEDIPAEVKKNLTNTCDVFNIWGRQYPKPVLIKRGYRDPTLNKKVGGSITSPHLLGLAADCVDKDGQLALWFMNHTELLKELGLYMENPQKTIGWVHLQTRPASQTIFNP